MKGLGLIALAILAPFAYCQKGPTVVMPSEGDIEGVTFDSARGAVYVPILEFSDAFGLDARYDSKGKQYTLEGVKIASKITKVLFDGSVLVDIKSLDIPNIHVEWDEDSNSYQIDTETHFGIVTVPEQWVEVNLTAQRLRAYQGNRLVMETKVSTGKRGYSTPTGEYTAGPEKSRYRTSAKYENAPMPFSVQLRGGYFIHGSSSVPNYPASHGCVRMPLTGMNAARYFYEWVGVGAPITLRYGWSERVAALDSAAKN